MYKSVPDYLVKKMNRMNLQGKFLIIEQKNGVLLLLVAIPITVMLFWIFFSIFSAPFSIVLFIAFALATVHCIGSFRFKFLGEGFFDQKNLQLNYKGNFNAKTYSLKDVDVFIRSPSLTEYFGRIGSIIRYSSLRFTSYDNLRYDYIIVCEKKVLIKIMSKNDLESLKLVSKKLNIMDFSPFTGPIE